MPKEEKGYWFSTENGTHIHAEEGESKESAMKKKFSNFGKKKETKKDSTFEEINAKRMGTDKGYDPSNRDESTKNHNKIIDSINARYSNNRISKEEYWKQIDEEVDRWNEEQEKHWKDDRPEFAKKIDEESKPAFDSAKKLDSIYKNAKEKNLDFERSLLNDIKSNPEAYNKIVLDNKEYVRNGNGFDFYENGKHIAFGTYNSVARDISDYYEDVESKLSKADKPKYQTIADVSSSVKKELKEKGFNTKGISVRGRNVGYSDALDITIKDPSIDIDEVRKLVNKHESYERDASGDILQGGNRYVNVKYEYGLFDSIGEENKEEATKLIEKVKSGNGSGIDLGNKHYLFHDKRDGQTFIHSNEYGMTPIYSPERLGSYLYQIKKFGRIVGR